MRIVGLSNVTKGLSAKGLVAVIGLAATASLIIYLIFIVLRSLQGRKEALKVKLPEIDGYGENVFTEPEFEEPKEFNVELIEYDEVYNDSPVIDKKEFLTALSLETKRCVLEEDDVIMPEIGSIEEKVVDEDSNGIISQNEH